MQFKNISLVFARNIRIYNIIAFSKNFRVILFYTQQSVEINQESTKSILTIKDSRQDHFGNFNCSMKNDYGVNSELIVLKSQSKYVFNFVVSAGI